ncbi:hypothetical protein BC629DRAFT_1276067 [Irpex lacteus]|nr:hypothetical protein BC629DRAFT_1276067 [Irpex lacteus]
MYPVDPTTKAVAEEVVVNVQGYAVRTNLPPITRRDSLPKNPVNLKQSIVLTGVGTKQFEQAARAVLAIRTLFSATLPGDTLLPWTPIIDGGHKCLEFSNRYFTSGNVEGSKPVEFQTGVDPKGILANLEVNGIHTDDNVVLYFERVEGETAKLMARDFTYHPINPVSIRPGALVEVQTSFCVVPIAKGRHIMLNKLRSICILSRQVIDVSVLST